MRRVDAPERPPLGDYDDVISNSKGKRKAGLKARRNDVKAGYDAYAAGRGRPHLTAKSDNWGKDEVKWQKAIYEHTYGEGLLKDLSGDVYAAAEGICLLCNAAQPGTIDHLLPQLFYPALSICAPNLIGACADCNRIKSTTSLDDPARQFVHPYFEDIPKNIPFMRADVIMDGVLSPRFEIVDHPDIDPELTARLRWQFGLLGVNAYCRNEAVLLFKRRQYGWKRNAENGWAALRANIAGDRLSVVHDLGVNYWESAFLQGLLDSPEFQADPVQYLAVDVTPLIVRRRPAPVT